MLRLLKRLYLLYFSRPAWNRELYRLVRRYPVARIVEFGIADGERARKLIAAARDARPETAVHYAAFDRFEDRRAEEGPGLSLRAAHQKLRATGAAVRLAPGDLFAALARTANDLVGTDLLLIAPEVDPAELARAWFYVPRMLHPQSIVIRQERQGEVVVNRRLAAAEILAEAARAARTTRRRAA